MYRLFDWACPECGTLREALVDVPSGTKEPTSTYLACAKCSVAYEHTRAPSLPAPYCGDKVFNPEVRGGKWDTLGGRSFVQAPELPGAEEHGRQTAATITQAMAEGVSDRALSDIRHRAVQDGPSSDDYMEHWARPEIVETDRQNKIIGDQNEAKQRRKAALDGGANINFRTDKLPGDPANITA